MNVKKQETQKRGERDREIDREGQREEKRQRRHRSGKKRKLLSEAGRPSDGGEFLDGLFQRWKSIPLLAPAVGIHSEIQRRI